MEPDYGNIDTFWAIGNIYSLSGEWGEVEIESGQPVLTIERR